MTDEIRLPTIGKENGPEADPLLNLTLEFWGLPRCVCTPAAHYCYFALMVTVAVLFFGLVSVPVKVTVPVELMVPV